MVIRGIAEIFGVPKLARETARLDISKGISNWMFGWMNSGQDM